MRLINKAGAQSVQHPVHGAAVAGPDGVFDVPTELGQALLADRYNWTTEAEHAAERTRAALEDLANPHKAPQVLHDLLSRAAALEHRVEELERTVADQGGRLHAVTEAHQLLAESLGEPQPDPEPDDEADAAPAAEAPPEPDPDAPQAAAEADTETPKTTRSGPDRPPRTRTAAAKAARTR